MQPLLTNWSEEKLYILECELVGYWAQDSWAFNLCPLVEDASALSKKNKIHLTKEIQFFCESSSLNIELKYACWKKLTIGEWASTTLWIRRVTISYIIEWLNIVAPSGLSLMQASLKQWELSFGSHLVQQGHLKEKLTPPRLTSKKELRQYRLHNVHITTFRQIYKVLQDAYDTRPEYEREVWDLRKLGYEIDPTKSNYRINFSRISQTWLLEAVQKFIRYSLSTCSVGESQGRLAALSDFSLFLQCNYPALPPSELDRPILLEYFFELSRTGAASGTRHRHIGCLRAFLELCSREGWLDVPDKRLIYNEDFPRIEKPLPRFIPEDIMAQLNQNLDFLQPDIMRMVLVLQEVGMRIRELCELSFNCLTQDTQGDYFLHYYQFKMKKDHTVPISKELVGVIQEQQQAVRERWGHNPLLFPNRRGKTMKQPNFTDALNRLAFEKQIRDAAGNLWHFQSHQFRHTVGTRMVNAGVPHHFIQRFLGHESPGMTSRYATIHDQTLKEEFAKFKGTIVDITGRAVQPAEIVAEIAEGLDVNSLDEQWLKKHVLTQALPNGICGLPAIQKSCPYGANKCYSCAHFKTDNRYLGSHKEHLERTEKIIAWAQEHPESSRSTDLLKENFPVQQGLERIIAALERNHDA